MKLRYLKIMFSFVLIKLLMFKQVIIKIFLVYGKDDIK